MKKIIGILLALALVLAFSLVATTPVAAATTYYVATTGDDTSGTGTESNPWATIQHAIDQASSGDTIMVAAGTYDLTSSIRVTKSVSIIGDIGNPANVVINAGIIPLNSGPKPPDMDRDGFQVAANNVVIRGFKIVNALTVWPLVAGDGWQNAGITVGGDITLIDWLEPYNVPLLIDGGTFSDNIIEDCSHGIYLAMARNTVVSNNIIRRSVEVAGREGLDGVGIINWNTKYWGTWQDPTGNTIEGNIIEDCRIAIVLGAWGERFSVSGTAIRNNILRNQTTGIELMYIDGPLNIQANDISSNNNGICIFGDAAHCTDVLTNCNHIASNTNWGMYNGGANSLDATLNWWGNVSGPTHSSNTGGTGDHVSNNVLFDPWIGKIGSVTTSTGTGSVSFASSHGGIKDLTPVAPPSLPSVTFPHGMFSFEICCLTPGETVILTVTLPSAVPVGTVWWKYDNGRWYSLPNLNDNGNNVMVIRLTDGGAGDSDGLKDGVITDPGGPGNPMTVGWDGSPIGKSAVLWPWIALFVAIMAGVGLLVWRRRRAQI